MNCPVCNVELKMADRQGVEVNYCPGCRGVWIERGGLDKIIDRSAGLSARSRQTEYPQSEYGGHHHDDDDDEHGHGSRRRRSFLSNLFD